MPNPAEQLDTSEIPEQEDGKPEPALASLDEKNLKNLEDGKTTISKVAREKERLDQKAKAEMEKMLTEAATGEDANRNDVQDLREELELLEHQMKFCETPEQMENIFRQIEKIKERRAKEKADEKIQAEKEKEKLDENDPRLEKLKEKFEQICKDNEHLIREGDVKKYIKWFENELRQNPTVAYGKEIIDRLEGKRVYDKDGLAPRREVYGKLEQVFKKYGINSPLKSEFIKKGGLKNRKEFLQGIKNAETEIKRVNDRFWSPKAKQKAMQEILRAKNPHEQKEFTAQINKINKIESEGFTYMKNTMSVGGTTVRKMSDASIAAFLSGLTNEGGIKKRLDYITGNGKYGNGIKEAVENEASLYGKEVKPEVAKLFGITKGLEEIYKDNPEMLKLAIKSFEKLDFMKKIEELKKHEKLVTKEKDKTELEKKLTLRAAHVAIDEAARKGIMSKGSAKKDKEWFSDKNKHKNPDTNKPGDLETLKKHYEILVSDIPDAKAKNISAYRIKRDRFKLEVKELKRLNPNINEKELTRWQEEYDRKGWTDRKQVYKDIKKEQEKLEKKAEKEREQKAKLDIKNDGKNTETLKGLTLDEIMKQSDALIRDKHFIEAGQLLWEYQSQNYKDLSEIEKKEIKLKINYINDLIAELGSGERREEETEKQVGEEIENIAKTDEAMKDRIEEANLKTLNLEGTRQSEERHEKKISAKDRAEKESMSRAQGELEEKLTKDYYDQTDDKHILNKEGTGEKITEIKFNQVNMTDQEREQLKDQTHKHESQLFNKTGFDHIEKTDETDKKISTEQAESKHEKEELEPLIDDLTDTATKKVEKKSATIFSLNEHIAAKRKARDLIEKERHSYERLKNAA